MDRVTVCFSAVIQMEILISFLKGSKRGKGGVERNIEDNTMKKRGERNYLQVYIDLKVQFYLRLF